LPDRLKSAYPGQILDADAHAVGEALQAGMVGYAISRADLVIVPTQGSLLDATEAANAIRLVRNQEKASGRTIPTAVLFTRASAALKPRSLRAIADELQKPERVRGSRGG
jgi:chromosome partitioning protein